jgi:hypothetical protein
MGLVDNHLLLSDNQAAFATSIIGSTNVVDLQHLRDIGRGEPMYVEFRVTEAYAVGAATTYQPTLYTAIAISDTAGASWYGSSNNEILLISGGTGVDVGILSANSLTFPVGRAAAALTLGTTWYMPIPTWHPSYGGVSLGQRYFGAMYLQYGFDATDRYFSAGKITTRIVDSTALPKLHYPIGYSE